MHQRVLLLQWGGRPATNYPGGVTVSQLVGEQHFTHGWFSCHFHGGLHGVGSSRDFALLASTAKQGHSFTFSGAVPDSFQLFVFGKDQPHLSSLREYPHAQASVASTLASAASLLCNFAHEDSSSASNVTMLFWHSSLAAVGSGVPSPHTVGGAIPHQHYVLMGGWVPPPATMGEAIPPTVPGPMGGVQMGGAIPPDPVKVMPMGGLSLIRCLSLIMCPCPWGVLHLPLIFYLWGVAFFPWGPCPGILDSKGLQAPSLNDATWI